MSPSGTSMTELVNLLESRSKPESMLEIGAGNSTWYLHQLNFDKYVAVEDYPSVVKNINEQKFSNFLMVDKWIDIPIMEYQYLFLDSNVGGDAHRHQRHKPLIYAIEHDLLRPDALIIVHDYSKIRLYRDNLGSKRSQPYVAWFEMEEKYGLRVIKDIGTEFGIYERRKNIS